VEKEAFLTDNANSSDAIKQLNQARFGRAVQDYVTDSTFRAAPELTDTIEQVQPESDWRVLDVATGGGHTALAFAPHVAQVIATDITPQMLRSARDYIQAQGADNVSLSLADAENLPFGDNTFDLVTCRIATHHFPDVFQFMQNAARVLKPGGMLLVQDHLGHEDERVSRYTDAFQRLRDPSHVRVFAEYEWRGLCTDAGLQVEHIKRMQKQHELLPWAKRQNCSADVIARLQVLLLRAPDAVTDWLQPEYAGTPYATFKDWHVILLARKPDA
jgi:ubiquinone/menaquinone biosynthesis C-methylase UbiE